MGALAFGLLVFAVLPLGFRLWLVSLLGVLAAAQELGAGPGGLAFQLDGASAGGFLAVGERGQGLGFVAGGSGLGELGVVVLPGVEHGPRPGAARPPGGSPAVGLPGHPSISGCAESCPSSAPVQQSPWGHLRACGEQDTSLILAMTCAVPSPRTRRADLLTSDFSVLAPYFVQLPPKCWAAERIAPTLNPGRSVLLRYEPEWSPARNVNGAKLMNDPWTVARGGVDLATAPAENPPVVYQDFESGTQGWSGWHLAAGPWQVTEWSARGNGSLKADVDLGTGAAYLNKVGPLDLSGDTVLSVDARTAPWGDQAGGTRAKLYVRTGTGDAAGWSWTDSGAVTVDTKSTRLVLDLTRVPDPAHVREIGVLFTPAPGATGRTAVYLDGLRRWS